MMHLIEQTHDEKIAMYLKLTKRELAEMLVTANVALRSLPDPTPEWKGTVINSPFTTWRDDHIVYG
ncbi:MAG: hypothetical protein IH919_07395 [Deltaproteobacteria bacterium]|nr:hypothetical protein [Deltaproteobacteria bacterium]